MLLLICIFLTDAGCGGLCFGRAVRRFSFRGFRGGIVGMLRRSGGRGDTLTDSVMNFRLFNPLVIYALQNSGESIAYFIDVME